MKTLMKDVDQNGADRCYSSNDQRLNFFGVKGGTSTDFAGGQIFLTPDLRDMHSSTAIGFGGAGWAQESRLATFDSTHLAFMHVTRAMPTRSGRPININSLRTCIDTHAPSRINLLDISPVNEISTYGIKHLNSVNCKNYTRAKKTNVVERTQNNADQETCQDISNPTFCEARPDIDGAENFDARTNNVITASSKILATANICHGSIFPYSHEVLTFPSAARFSHE